MKTFGARLRAARNARKLTQERLGERLGVSNTAVSRWESDIDQPSFGLLPALRTELRVSLDELICGDSQRAPHGVSEAAAKYGRRGYDPMLSSEHVQLLDAALALTDEKLKALLVLMDAK